MPDENRRQGVHFEEVPLKQIRYLIKGLLPTPKIRVFWEIKSLSNKRIKAGISFLEVRSPDAPNRTIN